MTLDELKSMNNKELAEFANKITNTKDFQQNTGAEFSYNTLMAEIKRRGGVKTYVFPDDQQADVITLVKTDETYRQQFKISKKVADKWKKFASDKPNRSVLLDHALTRFMDDFKRGKIKFLIGQGE